MNVEVKYKTEEKTAILLQQIEMELMLAIEENTKEAYQAFIKKYSNHDLAFEAQIALEMIVEEEDWKLALNKNSIDAFRTYRQKYPNSRYYVEAKILEEKILDQLHWKTIKKHNKLGGYVAYLKLHPTGKHVEEAAAIVAKAEKRFEIRQKKREKTIENLKSEAKKHKPKVEKKKEHKEKQPKQIVENLKQKNITSIKKLPIIEEEIIDDEKLIFDEAIKSNVPSAIEMYLEWYPNGNYAELARIKLKELNS